MFRRLSLSDDLTLLADRLRLGLPLRGFDGREHPALRRRRPRGRPDRCRARPPDVGRQPAAAPKRPSLHRSRDRPSTGRRGGLGRERRLGRHGRGQGHRRPRERRGPGVGDRPWSGLSPSALNRATLSWYEVQELRRRDLLEASVPRRASLSVRPEVSGGPAAGRFQVLPAQRRAERDPVDEIGAGRARNDDVEGRLDPRTGTRSAVTTREPLTMSPCRIAPRGRPSASGCPGEAVTDRPSASTRWTTWWPVGALVEPRASTVPVTLWPWSSSVQTLTPTFSDSTDTPPAGVSMSEPRARQIGQFGCPSGVCFSIVMTPVAEIVPCDACALRHAFLRPREVVEAVRAVRLWVQRDGVHELPDPVDGDLLFGGRVRAKRDPKVRRDRIHRRAVRSHLGPSRDCPIRLGVASDRVDVRVAVPERSERVDERELQPRRRLRSLRRGRRGRPRRGCGSGRRVRSDGPRLSRAASVDGYGKRGEEQKVPEHGPVTPTDVVGFRPPHRRCPGDRGSTPISHSLENGAEPSPVIDGRAARSQVDFECAGRPVCVPLHAK